MNVLRARLSARSAAWSALLDPLLAASLAAVAITAAPAAVFVALALVLGTILPGRAAVGGAGLLVAFVPGIVGTLAPTVAAVMPPSIGPWAIGVALGAPVPASTPIGWAVGMPVVAVIAMRAMERADL